MVAVIAVDGGDRVHRLDDGLDGNLNISPIPIPLRALPLMEPNTVPSPLYASNFLPKDLMRYKQYDG